MHPDLLELIEVVTSYDGRIYGTVVRMYILPWLNGRVEPEGKPEVVSIRFPDMETLTEFVVGEKRRGLLAQRGDKYYWVNSDGYEKFTLLIFSSTSFEPIFDIDKFYYDGKEIRQDIDSTKTLDWCVENKECIIQKDALETLREDRDNTLCKKIKERILSLLKEEWTILTYNKNMESVPLRVGYGFVEDGNGKCVCAIDTN